MSTSITIFVVRDACREERNTQYDIHNTTLWLAKNKPPLSAMDY